MNRKPPLVLLLPISLFACAAIAQTTKPKVEPPLVQRDKDGKLSYVADERGNRVPDYSYAGYRAGEAIPTVPAKLLALDPEQDNTANLQAAIDELAQLPADKDGYRGALLIPNGVYPINGNLRLSASGIVLRGSGETTLLATGLDRRPLIHVSGKADRQVEDALAITDAYVPVNANTLTLPAGHTIKPGDNVLVTRPSTKEWIDTLKMHDFGGGRHGPNWKPGSRDLVWDRVVTQVNGDVITLDAPITCALDQQFGGATVARYTWPGRAQNVGIENLTLESAFDKANPKDENHAWFAINIENAQDVFVRRVVAKHFVSSAVAVQGSAKRVTVEDCKSLAPVSEIGGWRRYAFYVAGQQVLMQRLWSEDAYHDFSVGALAAGPNAFVQVESLRSISFSGSIDSLAAGALFDRVNLDGQSIGFRNRGYASQGAGWSAISSTLWDSTAGVIENHQPPTGQNYAFGVWGEFNGDGYWYGANDDVSPDSLYYAQLENRLNTDLRGRSHLLLIKTDASSSPRIEVAQELAKLTREPRLTMNQWIDQVIQRSPLPTDPSGLPLAEPGGRGVEEKRVRQILSIKNGWLTLGDRVVTGGAVGVPWWNLTTRATEIPRTQIALTRFVPGRTGKGFTDDLNAVADELIASGRVTIEQHPPLWYDRRRDDHQRVRRADGNVVAPFYEWPYARSGVDLAYDGLSKWDLTRPNPWYWSRLREFTKIGETRGLLLTYQHYMQHSILEAGAHYADYPWRTANNVNEPGLPEPVYYAGDKRVFIAETFYDLSDPKRRELHRATIRMALDELKDRPNVVHLIGEEFTGPLHFVQFWLDTIGEWERETGRDVIAGLSATKDVNDAILADPERAKLVDLIDIRYWSAPRGDGAYNGPEGGKNLAPRQWQRIGRGIGGASPALPKAIRELRNRFPDKAVMVSLDGGDGGWASLIAGASRVSVKADPQLLAAIANCKPIDLNNADQFALADSGKNFVVYSNTNTPISVPLPQGGSAYDVQVIDPKGERQFEIEKLRAAGPAEIKSPGFAPYVLWIKATD